MQALSSFLAIMSFAMVISFIAPSFLVASVIFAISASIFVMSA